MLLEISGEITPERIKGKGKGEIAQSCLTLSDPIDCSSPGSAVHGIFQARVLEWGAISFSRKNKEMVPKQQHQPIVDATGDGSKV